MTSKELINDLGLFPHPEGGYYKETYRSEETTVNKNGDLRNLCTSIYFLLEEKDKSHFHRIQSDELWFFHTGQSLEIYYISSAGEMRSVTLGHTLSLGEIPFFRIPANTWFACKIKQEKGFSLVSCTVAPGFDFADFELATGEKLTQEFPKLKGIIEEFIIEQ